MRKSIVTLSVSLMMLASNSSAMSFAEIQDLVSNAPAKVSTQGLTLGNLGTFEFKKMNANVYVMHGPVVNPSVENEGFMNNPAIIEGKNGLIIVDPGGNYNVGKKILAQIQRVSSKPILATINTHKHGDHWFANKAIIEKYPNLKMYAHANMIKEAKAGEAETWYKILDGMTKNLKGTNDEFAYPNIELQGGDIINIDGQKFLIKYTKHTHTDTDIIVVHINSKTMFLGDNVMKGRLGAFDESSSMMGNIKLLEEVLNGDELTLYVPGHGPSGKMHETIDPFLNYVKVVVEEAGKAYEQDLESYEVKQNVIDRLKDYLAWDAFDNQMGKHLMKAYSEFEENDI